MLTHEWNRTTVLIAGIVWCILVGIHKSVGVLCVEITASYVMRLLFESSITSLSRFANARCTGIFSINSMCIVRIGVTVLEMCELIGPGWCCAAAGTKLDNLSTRALVGLARHLQCDKFVTCLAWMWCIGLIVSDLWCLTCTCAMGKICNLPVSGGLSSRRVFKFSLFGSTNHTHFWNNFYTFLPVWHA